MIQAVVEAHDTHNNFYPDWEVVKERPTEPDFPAVFWKQYTGRLVNDGNGWKRQQLVQLWVVTSSDTDRTPEELQQDVEAADKAANDFVLKLDQDYRGQGFEFGNVSITTIHDEYTQLLTGVILSFTVTGGYSCIDEADFPGGGSGGTVTIVDQDDNVIENVTAPGTYEVLVIDFIDGGEPGSTYVDVITPPAP